MMCSKLVFLLRAVFFLHFIQEITSHFEFTNLKCISEDKTFSGFEYCYLKSVNRTYKYANIKVKLYQTPITKIKINAALFKRFNGYRPFMYNVTCDVCRYLKNPNPMKSDPIFHWFVQFFKNTSNMIHPCPFDHDLEVLLPISWANNQLTILPFPGGDYMVETTWFAYDIKRANVKFYGTLY